MTGPDAPPSVPGTVPPWTCCDELRARVTLDCDQHTLPQDCPDVLIVWSAGHREFGLPVRDGGASFVAIDCCPWCGTALDNL